MNTNSGVLPILAALAIGGFLAPLVAEGSQTPDWMPAEVAADIGGELWFEALDGDGEPGPVRFTFLAEDGSRPELFTNTQADPDGLAVRGNIIYSLSGQGAITVPEGVYTVYASRGLEYEIASRTIEFRDGSVAIWTPVLKRELETPGWVSGDFHLHTLTHSGHGDSNMAERVISMIGEGVEFAVATDHNHNTDYEPTMRDLGVPHALRAVTGNEVSTPIGHFNAFPLDPGAAIIDPEIHDADELFRLIRAEHNEFKTVPVVQVNHPRWGGIDYFGQFGFDPVTGVSDAQGFSYDFDSVEVFNENEGWGYIDPDESDLPLGSGSFSVLRDWFNLLNRGHRIAAVGNSDSHDVASELAGWPRNYIVSSTDTPKEIDPAEIAANIRAKRVYTTFGPIVDFRVNDTLMGGSCTARQREDGAGWVDVALRVRVPSWIDCDRVMIVVNGEIVRAIPVEQSTEIVRLEGVERVHLDGDSWVSLLVEGDTPLEPIVHTQGRPIYPWAVLNPVWVDVDADGRWESPVDQAKRRLKGQPTQEVLADLTGGSDARWLTTLIAVAESGTLHKPLIRAAVKHENRRVRLAATVALERGLRALAENGGEYERRAEAWRSPLRDAVALSGDDQHLRMRILMALDAAGDEQVRSDALLMLTDEEQRSSLRPGFEPYMISLLGGSMLRDWSVAAYFDSEAFGTLRTQLAPTEIDPDAAMYLSGKGGGEVRWRSIEADPRGYVNLREFNRDDAVSENAIATARLWFISDGTDVGYAFGADDASRLTLNGQIIYEEHTDHSANPLQQIGRMTPNRGLNELLVTVENGGGGFGFYFRVFDDAIIESATTTRPSTAMNGEPR